MSNVENFVARATVNSNGQVTLPQAVLDQLACKDSQTLVFTGANGRITLAREAGTDEEAVFVPDYEALLSYNKCLDQCTFC
ncbi:AbrB/MazE/SpoVT family DNA-binding domain-containing protein [Lactovum odontotermitis]